MKKVIILGSPGAGKSTFARKLRDLTGLPLYYLDLIWHKPDRTTVSRPEFDAALGEILATDEWIIDGDYSRTVERRLAACDTAFLLDYPVEVCVAGVTERVGQVREEMPWTATELDPELVQYIRDFAADQLPHDYELLARYAEGRNIVILHSREEADAWLRLYEADKACYTEKKR